MILPEKYAHRKEQSYEIMKIFVTLEKAKSNRGNTRGLYLATIKLETVQISKLQLQQKLRKIRQDLLEEAWADRCRVYIVDVLCIHCVTLNNFKYYKSRM
jgi:hypothetical protein